MNSDHQLNKDEDQRPQANNESPVPDEEAADGFEAATFEDSAGTEGSGEVEDMETELASPPSSASDFGFTNAAEYSDPSPGFEPSFAPFLGADTLPVSRCGASTAEQSVVSNTPWPLSSFSVDAFAGAPRGTAFGDASNGLIDGTLRDDRWSPGVAYG